MKILKKIKLSKQEKQLLDKKVSSFLEKLNKDLKDAKAIAGGSYAKNTILKDNYDIDIFVKFNYKLRKQDISKLLEKSLKKKFRYTKVHGSRDYFHVKLGKHLFEVVPVLNIKKAEQALNVTDVSPLHVNYIKKKGKGLEDDIRLVKQFCKANNLYGAESYIKGFSGYVLEVLTIYYGSFNKLIKNAAKWRPVKIIDPERYYKNKEEIIKSLNKSKRSSLILIDPVQKDRNAAAALSKEKFELFNELIKQYLKNPSEIFFVKKEVALKELKDYLIIKVKPVRGKKDIVGAKLVKDLEFIKKKLEDFEVLDYGWKWNRFAYFYFKVKKKKLNKYRKNYGPSKKHKEHLENFKKKWKGKRFNYDKGKIYVNVLRENRDVKKAIKSLNKNIKNKIISIKINQRP